MYEEAQTRAGSIGAAYATSPASAPTLLSSLLADLSEAQAVASDVGGALYDTRLRLFGPWPEKGEASISARQDQESQSVEAQIGEAIARLRSALMSARDHADIIRNRL